MVLTVRGVHPAVYRQRPAIQQLQQDVCLQLQFRSPLVEAIGKRANIPLPFLGSQFGPLTDAHLPTYCGIVLARITHQIQIILLKNWLQKFEVATIDFRLFNPLKKKGRLFYLKIHFVPYSKHFLSLLRKPISLCCKWHKSLFVLR